MSVYLREQEWQNPLEKGDHVVCSNRARGFNFTSFGPRLVLVLRTSELRRDTGFRAKVSFKTGNLSKYPPPLSLLGYIVFRQLTHHSIL